MMDGVNVLSNDLGEGIGFRVAEPARSRAVFQREGTTGKNREDA